jgi:hypothetical protein
VNRKELEMRIWGKTIASAKKKGIISEEEAQFLLDEYLKEFKVKNGWDGVSHFIPRVFWILSPRKPSYCNGLGFCVLFSKSN